MSEIETLILDKMSTLKENRYTTQNEKEKKCTKMN